MDPAYRPRNDAARARLATLVTRLTPADLDLPLGEGWTVKAALLHLAFWDRLAAAAVDDWQRTGVKRLNEVADAYINRAALTDWLAAPPEHAPREVLRAAEAVDQAAAGIDETMRADLVAAEETWVCERSVHRNEHIQQIERTLGHPTVG